MAGLRIGDAEREAAVSALGEHFAQGRLNREEHDERTDAVWTARTADDVAPLFRDLPQGSPLAPSGPSYAPTGPPAGRRATVRRGFAGLPLPVQVLLVVLAVVLVVGNLPLILLAGAVWFLLSRHGGCGRPPWASRTPPPPWTR